VSSVTGFGRGRRARALALGMGFAGLSSCTLVLGIEQATVDPTLASPHSPDAAGGAAGEREQQDASAASDAANLRETSAPDTGDALVEAGPSAVCTKYCDDVTANCSGAVKQYVDKAQCLVVCSLLPEGVLGASEGNSAACRGKNAALAKYASGMERDAYCAKAGPGSDGTCGTVCEGYCSLMMPTCKTMPYAFASRDACLADCGALRDAPPYSVTNDLLPDRNDAQCRLFHANSAVMDSDEHCEHAMGVTMCTGKPDGG
jgi:hypothetical protein